MPFAAEFFVRGEPKAQPRAKATKRGNHASVYDPGTADDWKSILVREARPFRPELPLEGPLSVSLCFYFRRPKRLMRAKDPDGPVRHISKPDRDNCEKAVLDALKQDGWMRDDSQVCTGPVEKFYHSKSGIPGCLVRVQEVGE